MSRYTAFYCRPPTSLPHIISPHVALDRIMMPSSIPHSSFLSLHLTWQTSRHFHWKSANSIYTHCYLGNKYHTTLRSPQAICLDCFLLRLSSDLVAWCRYYTLENKFMLSLNLRYFRCGFIDLFCTESVEQWHARWNSTSTLTRVFVSIFFILFIFVMALYHRKFVHSCVNECYSHKLSHSVISSTVASRTCWGRCEWTHIPA